MTVVVQVVTVKWTKLTRPAPAAVTRNALPRAMPIHLAEAPYLFDEHLFLERPNGAFAHRLGKRRTGDHVPERESDLIFVPGADGALSVNLERSESMGAPRRRSPPIVIELRKERYCRFTTNGRHSGWAEQWYTRQTYNVIATNRLSEEIFTARPPDKEYGMEADLT